MSNNITENHILEILTAIKRGFDYVVIHEPLDELTRHNLVLHIDNSLSKFKFDNGIAVDMVCDESNNPPELIDERKICLHVHIYKPRSTLELHSYVIIYDGEMHVEKIPL